MQNEILAGRRVVQLVEGHGGVVGVVGVDASDDKAKPGAWFDLGELATFKEGDVKAPF